MKTTTILIVAAVAAIAVIAPWIWVVPCDSFDYVQVGESYHKVFSYGFPIPIRECGQDIPARTPPGQTPFRVAGNFVIFFAGGLIVADLLRCRRNRT